MELTERQRRDQRMARLGQAAALKKAEIHNQLLATHGAVLPAQEALLCALVDVELVRLEAAEDVAERGQRERYSNGRQTLERKNPAVDTLLKASAAEAKIMTALGLSKRRSKPAAKAAPDCDTEDDLDDY